MKLSCLVLAPILCAALANVSAAPLMSQDTTTVADIALERSAASDDIHWPRHVAPGEMLPEGEVLERDQPGISVLPRGGKGGTGGCLGKCGKGGSGTHTSPSGNVSSLSPPSSVHSHHGSNSPHSAGHQSTHTSPKSGSSYASTQGSTTKKSRRAMEEYELVKRGGKGGCLSCPKKQAVTPSHHSPARSESSVNQGSSGGTGHTSTHHTGSTASTSPKGGHSEASSSTKASTLSSTKGSFAPGAH